MILIVYSWVVGGIQTFYLRLAKERSVKGKKTTIIYLGKNLDLNFLSEIEDYATVHCISDYFCNDIKFVPPILSTLFPRRKNKVINLLSEVSQVHTCSCIEYFVAKRLVANLKLNVRVTIGVYHINEYVWKGSRGVNPPFFEKCNQDYFYNRIDKNNIIVFNETVPNRLYDMTSKNLGNVNVFPVGIDIPIKTVSMKKKSDKTLKICSVGRLVEFKTYNYYMVEVVYNLRLNGINVIYDIYGEGPSMGAIQKCIDNFEQSENINLMGKIEYADFNTIVSKYDLFIGNGTSIIESSSLGIPSIIGIENAKNSQTYGFFSDIDGYAYNIDGLYKKSDTLIFIEKLLGMTNEEFKDLSKRHKSKAKEFSISKCSSNFDNLPEPKLNHEELSYFLYLSYLISFLSTNFLSKFGLYQDYTSKYES
ncbi:hypothetical protein [Vibrio sp. 99-8-1]|uniref:hypothetical protein n=1 Tax=Vibrio sp. 99-8-1 TaxID=2607602 RepID=UPI001493DC04|nr:hypothetical protein [Vibrio sp. 99-8-1]NOI68713.1 glycosyltransferase family 4 protein [Vibrio sp. 99-8-1]